VPFSVTRIDASRMPVAARGPLRQLQGKNRGHIDTTAVDRVAAGVLLRGPTRINATGRGQIRSYIVAASSERLPPDINLQDIQTVGW